MMHASLLFAAALGVVTSLGAPSQAQDLMQRGYIISEESNELFVVDLATMTSPGSVDTTVEPGHVNENHMAAVTPDGSTVYVMATHENALVVIDAATLTVTEIIEGFDHPSHARFRPGTTELWVVNEDGRSITVVDTATNTITATIRDRSLIVPHYVRFSPSGRIAYVPVIGGNQVVIMNAESHEILDMLVPQGLLPGPCSADPCGFADAQIDPNGILHAAHIESSTLIRYDINTHTRLPDTPLGDTPWIAYVDMFGGNSVSHYLVPNFGDSTLTRVPAMPALASDSLPLGDTESYGVNYSPLAPDLGFVLNRNREEIVVVDLPSGQAINTIVTQGTAETACTTGDGRYLILPLSTVAGKELGDVVIIDVVTQQIVKRFEDVGRYPWSSATAAGQNYCH